MQKVSRRTVLAGMGAAAAAATLPAMPAIAADRSIRHFWWGNPERDKRTFAVIDVFQKHHPEIAVSGETVGWGDYWTKMATQTAGRNMADLVQMDYSLLFEYSRRGALRSLDEYIGKGLDLSHFDKGPTFGRLCRRQALCPQHRLQQPGHAGQCASSRGSRRRRRPHQLDLG